MKHAVCIIGLTLVMFVFGCSDTVNITDVTTPNSELGKGSQLETVGHETDSGPTVPYKGRASGTLTTVSPGFLSFTAIGNATHLGRYTEVGSNNFDEFGNVSNGVFTYTAADGSTLSGTYSGTYTPLPTGDIRFNVNVDYVQGTGRLAGVTGDAQLVATLSGVALGAAFTYETRGSLVFP